MTSPTARSLDQLRKDGWTADVVEHWVSWRDAKLDKKLWELVDELLEANDLLLLDLDNDEKQFRHSAAFHAIYELRKLYRPPVRPGNRKDLYGFGDILAFRRMTPRIKGVVNYREEDCFPAETMIVQATSFANLNSRIVKAQRLDAFHNWLAAGNLVEFHGWRVRALKTGDGSTCKVVRFPET